MLLSACEIARCDCDPRHNSLDRGLPTTAAVRAREVDLASTIIEGGST